MTMDLLLISAAGAVFGHLSSDSVPEKWLKRREPLPEGFER